MLNKGSFILAHQIGDRRFYSTYKYLVSNQWKKYEELKIEQEKQLKHMINFAYKNVPYYHKLFYDLGLEPDDFKKIEDLEKLPILTKNIIRENWSDFIPTNLQSMRYYNRATGGSTGTPFKYRLSKYDRFLSGAMLYRGWGYGGYELGDKMIFLAGSSLGVNKRSNFTSKIHEVVRNIKKLSSFDMSSNNMESYVNIINTFKPKFFQGYASSLYFFANFVEENDIQIMSPEAVITTAEKLYPNMRTKLESVFECDVFDSYGLNDGGVTAFECTEHGYLHIDTERSVMEIVDDDGSQITEGVGSILATNLYNYSMPFIRYNTDDMGHIVDDVCPCGRNYKVLKEIVGRQQEILQTPEGNFIHGQFFVYIFKEINNVLEFQVIQKTLNKIIVKILPESGFDEKQLNLIKSLINQKSPEWDIEFKFVDKIDKTGSGKYKFVINELKK